ncbi:hypothetical protein RRF57_005542 [Xylaria bambusicola]|uniref:Uncharacterized protein n=1 Tax=Xylaria bambusicola TaxID=326684 RepID=A0AAN7Z647_9PEZI
MPLNQDGEDEGLLMTVMTYAEWEDGQNRLRQIVKEGLEAVNNIAVREETWEADASTHVPSGGSRIVGAKKCLEPC